MDGGSSFNGSHEMTISHTNGTASENHRSVVTMAEVSSQEITSAETPQQPQAVSCVVEPQSLSTVHVQKPSSLPSLPSISSGVPVRPKSENHAPKIRLLTRTPAMKSMSSPPPSFQMNEPDLASGDVGLKEPPDTIRNSMMTHAQSVESSDSSHSGHSGKLDEYFTSKNSVSREGSFDYTDSTGVDLEKFIVQTLKNPRDKKMLLRLESDFTNFINDPSRPILHYPPMTSYHRMIVHRVAAYFGMDHNVDMTGKSVIMNKTMNTRIPEFKFREFLSRENSEEDSTGNGPRTILKRESMEEGTPPKVESPKPSSVVHPLEEKRSKSFEEREEEYSKARARIFNQESMSSQSSQSSKDGGDLEPIQILQATRDSETETENKDIPPPSDEQAPYTSEKTEEEDNPTTEDPDEHKENEVPKTSAVSQTTVTERPQQQQAQKGYGGSKARQQSGSTPTLTSWAAEGAPLMPPTLGPGDFIFPYPSLPGIVPVMSQHSHKPLAMPEYHPQHAGGVVWNFPVDAMQQPTRPHGPAAYITPQTGVQVMTPDGMAVYPAHYHTMAAMKPTPQGHGAYVQHPHQSATPSQSVQQPVQVQSPPHPQPQMIIPQHYYGMQQPVYYMPHQHRLPYPTQQALDPNQRWPTPPQQPPQVAQSPTSSSYPDIAHQFSGMSLVPRPEVEPQHQQRPGTDSANQAAASYGGTQAQVMQTQQPHIQYVFVPPQGQYRPGVPVIAQQMPQHGSSQQASYVYGHNIYQGQFPQYGLSTEPVLQPRSQTPPTPPRTTSPIISSPQFPPHPVTQTGPNSQPMARPQQTITPPYHQRTPPQTPSTRPFLLQGPHGLPIPPTHVVPMGHASSGAAPQQIATSPSAYGFSQGQMFPQQPQQQVAQRKSPNERRVGKADVYIPDNTVKSQSSPVTSPSQGVTPGVQYWTGHNAAPNAPIPPPRLDLNQQRFLQSQAVAHYQHQHQHQHAHNYQYQMQQFPKNKQRPYRQRQGTRTSSNDSSHNKRGGGGGNHPGPSSQETEKSSESSSSITTSSGTGASQILEVYDYPEGIKNHQADLLFDELKKTGARIQWLSNSGPSSSPPQGGGSAVLLAIFSSSAQAQRALDTIKSSSFKLRVPPHHTVLQKSSDGNMKN